MIEWIQGRAKTNYLKKTFFEFGTRRIIDCHLLKFPEGSSIPRHRDVVTGMNHFRLNIVLSKPWVGGVFKADSVIFKFWRFVLFRPDQSYHEFSEVESGTRYVLSIGFASVK